MEKIKEILQTDYLHLGIKDIKKLRKINTLIFIGIGIIILGIIFHLILGISTNYHKLDDLDDYVDDYQEGKYFSNFDKINLGVKIMPSYNLQKNILFMDPVTEVS